jgi:hypothetical protein
MKTKLLAIAFFLMIGVSATASEATSMDPNVRAAELLSRVEQIRNMEFNELSSEQKVELKDELRSMRYEMKELRSNKGLDDKVSISVGLIIIILLLIILL